jgi:hypothetical protein
MGVTTTQTNKPLNPRAQDASPLAYNRAKLFSGKALDFDGVNDDVDLDGFTLSGTTATISFYYKSDLASKTYGYILDNTQRWVIGQADVANKFGFYDGSTWRYSTQTLTTGEWYHITAVIEGGNVEFLWNGQSVGDTFTGANSISWASLVTFKLGWSHTASSSGQLDGQIAGFKIFNTALTAAQVADLYNNPEKVVPTGVDNTALKLWLPMQEGAGTTAYDGSGNGNHGTISGATYVHGIGAPVSQTAVIDWNKGTNLLLNSIDPSAGNWTIYTDTTLTGGQSDAIGGTNGFLFAWSAGAGQRAFYQTHSTDNGTYSLSLYAKAGTHDCFQILFANDGSNYVNFDLTNGTTNVYAGGSSSIEVYGTDGWYKCEYTYPSTQATRVNIWAVDDVNAGRAANITSAGNINMAFPNKSQTAAVGPYIPTLATAQTSPVLLPQGLTTGRDITGVNLFENVRKQGALNLDGNSWAEVHDNASFNVGNDLSVEFWAFPTRQTTGNEDIFGKYISGSPPYNSYGIEWVGAKFRMAYGDTSNVFNTLSNSTDLSVNNWYHVVGTYDGANLKIYINGTESNTIARTSDVKYNNENVYIGTWGGAIGSATQTFKDQIAQPRIYNRALTAEEVQRNYNAGKNIYS